jgi:hypothetical protein
MAGFTRIYPDKLLKSGRTEVGGQSSEIGDRRSIDDLRLHRLAEPARAKPARGLQAASASERESTYDRAVGTRTMMRRKRRAPALS